MRFKDLDDHIVAHVLHYAGDLPSLSAIAVTSRRMNLLVLDLFKAALTKFRNLNPLLSPVPSSPALIRSAYHRLTRCSILIIGGSDNERRCDSFNVLSGRFGRICSMGIKRSAPSSTACFYKGLVFSISGAEGASIGTVEVYDIFRNDWRSIPPLPGTITALTATDIAGKLYLIGGQQRIPVRNVDIIYILQEQYLLHNAISEEVTSEKLWRRQDCTLTTALSCHASAAYRDRIWIVGGGASGHVARTSRSCEVFDPATQTSVQAAQMVSRRLRCSLVVAVGGLYAVGSDMHEQYPAFAEQATIEWYNEEVHAWEVVTMFPEKRRGSAVAAVGDRIYLFGGGSVVHEGEISTWDYFDVSTRTWGSTLPSLPSPPSPPSLTSFTLSPPATSTANGQGGDSSNAVSPPAVPVSGVSCGPWPWRGRQAASFSLAVAYDFDGLGHS
jgi:hypothetical protein